jgi:hypothetical protein
MPGFLGGSSSGSGTSGEIRFPAELIDPVTKLRVSEPQTMMDTDFEYGLQPTKWETVELINNTPSFFSASGDTTIPNLLDLTTTADSREIKVTTSLPHGLAVGIPLNVSGSKSLTADGAYIINSVPDTTTFTYLCKQNQLVTASIIDLYTSVITGQFFQGSQIKIADSEGIVTNASGSSTLTVKTDSPHGFGVNTPFYFLNLNSTISQEFDSSNTGAKTFDSSNTATAQSFDGSNTLTSYSLDLSNKANIGATPSSIVSFNATTDTITVTHTAGQENFAGKQIGTPLYYNISAASGYFATRPRGVVYLKSTALLGTSSSEFQVSATPGGDAIDLTVTLSGTIQLAVQAALFAGNNTSATNETTVALTSGGPLVFDGANNLGSVNGTNTTFSNGSALIQTTNNAGSGVSTGLSVGSMVLYTTTGTAAGGLTNNTTYWLTYFNIIVSPAPGLIQIKLSATVGGSEIVITSQGSGTHTFQQIGVSVDKDVLHIPAHGLVTGDMVKYSYPSGGALTRLSFTKDYMYITRLDANNVQLESSSGLSITGGPTPTTISVSGQSYKVLTFTTVGTSTVNVTGAGTVDYMVVAGGGSGGSDMGGGGGAGGYLAGTAVPITSGTVTVTVGAGGQGDNSGVGNRRGWEGGNSSIVGGGLNIVSLGGGGGASNHDRADNPALRSGVGSGGGGSGGANNNSGSGYGGSVNGFGTPGQGNNGAGGGGAWYPGGGGGAGAAGQNTGNNPQGGIGVFNDITGTGYYWAGGGGGAGYTQCGGQGGNGGGGGGSPCTPSGGAGLNPGQGGQGGGTSTWANVPGGNAGANTGGGGGGGAHYNSNNRGGYGGSGIVVIRYKG